MSEPAAGDPSPPRVGGVMTVFYYEDLAPAVAFYERLGFAKAVDLGWVAIFRISGASMLTLVDATGGSQTPIRGSNKGAILSIETDALEAWRERLARIGVAEPNVELKRGCEGRSVEIHVRDPGGYLVEFFQWVDPPPGWKI